jgi:uncharacterized protein (DUF1684 family)
MKVNLSAKLMLLIILSLGWLLQCTTGFNENSSYRKEISNWRSERMERLKSQNGWLNLVGLFWIKDGVNSFGSDSSNNLIFPAVAPAKAGTITLKDSIITIHFNDTEGVSVDDQPAKDCRLFPDDSNHTTHVQLGRYAFTIIKRGNKFAVRLRDMESPLLGRLDSIPAFPVSRRWKVKAKLEKFGEPKTYEVNTVIGIPETYTAAGKLVFKLNGKDCSLIPFNEGDKYFIIFGDETSSLETYAAGRFLSAAKVDSSGYTVLDFNKATNPPCAFTPYATCPLPLRDNILSVRVEAGEKDVHLYKH